MTASHVQLVALFARVIVTPGIVIGAVGNILNTAVLTRSRLYNHPCSRYFLALSSNNLFFSVFLLTYNLLVTGYHMDLATIFPVSCKIITYIQQVSAFSSPYFILLASADRFCLSSSSARIRNISNLSFARWSILSVIMFYALFFINSLVLVDVQPGLDIQCSVSPTTLYRRIYPIIQAVLLCLVPPLLMIVFGLLTIRNATAVRAMPAASARYRRTEHQLARMLSAQVICHILLSTPLCVIYASNFIPVKNLSPVEYYVAFRITQIIFSISYTTSVFLYFLSARIYRKELWILILMILRRQRINRIVPGVRAVQIIPMNAIKVSSLRK